MSKYKISVSIDGENFFWIVVSNQMLIRNPTKDDLIGTKVKYYNKTNICSRCREDKNITDKSILYPKNAQREYDKNGNWNEKWLCFRCYRHDHWVNVESKYSDSHNNIIKALSDRRTGNLKDSHNIFGDNCEELTCRWRSTVTTIPVENLNKKLDNYMTSIDHSLDSELGIIQTKGRLYNSYHQMWVFSGLEREWNKIFNYEICYCVSKDGKKIERLYIFPKEEIKKRTSIGIYKNPLRKIQWYEEYRIKDEKILELVNKLWQEIIEGD